MLTREPKRTAPLSTSGRFSLRAAFLAWDASSELQNIGGDLNDYFRSQTAAILDAHKRSEFVLCTVD